MRPATRTTALRIPFVWGIVLAALAGCGEEGAQQFELRGQVRYQNEEVSEGTITLTPDSSAGNVGPGSFAQIKDGSYRTASGKGVVGGPYRVRISSYFYTDTGIAQRFPPYEVSVDLPREDSLLDFEVPTGPRPPGR